MTRFNLTLSAPAAAIEATDTETRRLAGVAIPYGEQGATSAGVLTIDAGAVKVPPNLKAVKLFREHGRLVPTGYAVEATDSDDALRMAFTVARTPDGDRALTDASEGLRDALSVELHNVEVKAGHVVAADLVAVAQVAVPAFANAVLTAALTDEAQAEAHDLASQLVDLTAPTDDTETPTEETPPAESESTMTQTTDASRPANLSMAPAAPARRTDSAKVWAAQAAEAIRGATDAAQVNAALQDITPANAGTDGLFPRHQWIGEAWNARAASRWLVDAIGVSPLTAMVVDSWKWATEPVVAPYAGNKTAIPSSPASIVPAQATAQRIAGGWDLDRIYVDFNTGFLEAFQQAAMRDYVRKSQTYLIEGHAAITGPPAIPAVDGLVDEAHDLGAQPDAMAAIAAVTSYLAGNGANTSFIALASDVFGAFLGLTPAEVPWWLANQGSVALGGGGSADVAGTAIGVDPGLAAGTVLGGDRDAVSFWETGPINVQAVNIPNGGIDYALFGYYAHQVHDDAGLATAQVTVTAAAAASRTAKKSS